MILNTATSLYGTPNSQTIHYFNGTANSLEVENFELFWELLLKMKKNTSKKDLEDWASQKKINNISDILSQLQYENIILEAPTPKSSHEQRYINYFLAYKNGQDFMKRLENLSVMIIGTGTIGSTLAMSLAKMNIKNLILVDTDNVEAHNINSQMAFDLNDIGFKKTSCLINKLHSFSPKGNFTSYDMYINDSTLLNLLHIIETKKPDLVFSCFDDASYNVHNSIYNSVKKINGHYILNGYINDEIISISLDNDEIKEEVLASYNEIDFEYSIPANRGIITQSLSSSLINCIRVLNYADNENLGDSYISIDVRKLDVHKKNNFTTTQKLLKESYNLDETFNLINYANTISMSEDTQDYYSNKFVELSTVFHILENLGDNTYSDEYEAILYFSAQDNDDSLIQIEPIIEKYHSIIDNLYIDGEPIYKALAKINYEPSYQKRKIIQEQIFVQIKEVAPDLLEILREAKLFHYQYSNFLEEEYTINKDCLLSFFDINRKNIWNLALPIYKMLFPNGNYDYLFDIEENIKIQMNFRESIKFISGIFSETSCKTPLHFDISQHLKRLLSDQLIFDIKGKKVYDTFYLPSINKSIIIFDHFDTMYSILLLAHEIGHSYFSQFYGKNFYNTSNKIINETLAQFFEIIFIQEILSSSKIEKSFKKGVLLQYLYRINQCVISSLLSEDLENTTLQHILKHGNILIDDFLNLNKPAFQENGVKVKNQENSRLNILLFSPFVTSYKDLSIGAFTYSLAIALFEKYSCNMESFLCKIIDLLGSPNLSIDLFIEKLFYSALHSEFYEQLTQHFHNHIDKLRKESYYE